MARRWQTEEMTEPQIDGIDDTPSKRTDDVSDEILEKIARDIYGKVVVNNLGNKLGYNVADIGRFNGENEKEGGSHFGTLDMLRKWRLQTNTKRRERLKAALEKADLASLTEYLSAEDMEQHPIHTPAAKKRKIESSQDPEREKGDEKEKHTRSTPAAKTRKVESSHDPERAEDNEKVKPVGKDCFDMEMTKATPSDEQLDPNKNYTMDVSVTKGRMFIFNMSETRKGSDLDVEKIKYVFKEIGFKTKTYSDLTAKEFKDELEKFVTSPKHERMCSAVFVIMAHGNETGIQCKYEQIVPMKFIMDKVNTMKHMNGKPKIIFFQCCRGDEELKKLEMDKAGTDVPAKSDVLRVYATTDGNGAYRDPDDGSWFIQLLCEELLENAHVSDLCTMLEQVTGKVAKMDSDGNGQCVEVVKQGISKKIYFLPKYSTPKE